LSIQPIVEGHGDVTAVPVLLRRLRDEAQAFEWDVLQPIRRKRSEFRSEGGVARAVRVAARKPSCRAIVLIFDSDGDAPCEWGPRVAEWARNAAGTIPCHVVLAHKEYEAWFLAAVESLRGKRGIREDADPHPDPESLRGAKAHLEERMQAGRAYGETIDQAPLTAAFDMGATYRRCRSFRKLVKAFGEVIGTPGTAPAQWPPAAWLLV
jgi:hypothetical protein